MPRQRWPTEFHYVDGGLEQADATDFVCVNRIIATLAAMLFGFPRQHRRIGGPPR